MVTVVLHREYIKGHIAFAVPTDAAIREAIRRELVKCRDKHNDYVLVTIAPPKPESESSTDECAKLIEAAHILAADLGIILKEE